MTIMILPLFPTDVRKDLIYEGITTIFSTRTIGTTYLVRKDLIYEGITTLSTVP